MDPPSFIRDEEYDKWRIGLQQWRMTTDVEPRRQALVVRTKLSGRAREIALGLDAADLNSDFGMDLLLENLDKELKKQRRSKWDVPKEGVNPDNRGNDNRVYSTEQNKYGGKTRDESLSAADRARQRAAELSAKLAAAGKYQTQPLSLLPTATANPVDQFDNKFGNNPNLLRTKPVVAFPEIMKKDTSGYFANVEINDLVSRPFLTKRSTHDLLLKKTGCCVSLRGRYMTPEEKRANIVGGLSLKDRPLTLTVEADISAKVQVGLHKIFDVDRNYARNPEHSHNDYGLSDGQQQSSRLYQDKVYIRIQPNPSFNFNAKLMGEGGSNFQFIVKETGANVFLRGKGSGQLEMNSKREAFEPLHIGISHHRQSDLIKARELCTNLMETVIAEYNTWLNAKQIVIPQGNMGPYRPPGYAVQQAQIPGYVMQQARPPVYAMQQPGYVMQQPRMVIRQPAIVSHQPPLPDLNTAYPVLKADSKTSSSPRTISDTNTKERSNAKPDTKSPQRPRRNAENTPPRNQRAKEVNSRKMQGMDGVDEEPSTYEELSEDEEYYEEQYYEDEEYCQKRRKRKPVQPDPKYTWTRENGKNSSSENQSGKDQDGRNQPRSPQSRSPDNRKKSSYSPPHDVDRYLPHRPRHSKLPEYTRSDERSRSPSRRSSSQDKSFENIFKDKRVARKFTEEPKKPEEPRKRRRFSEDPKLLEKNKRRFQEIPTQPRPSSPKITKIKVPEEKFMSPNMLPIYANIPKKKQQQNSEDIFEVPKPKSSVLKMGALSSIAAYNEDSDSSDND